jgi:hypothetical protein
VFEQPRIGRRELIFGKLVAGNPDERRAMNRARFAGRQFASKKFEMHCALRVIVHDLFNEFVDGRFDADLFAQFALETLLECFARLTFTAGKFPKAGQMGSGQTLGNEKFASVEEQGSGDFEVRGHQRRPMLL